MFRYRCEFCGRTFQEARFLKAHMGTHQPEKRTFQCDQCPMSFLNKFHLQSHVKHIHEEVKSYGCTECDKRFSYSFTLQSHIRNCHSTREFICEICAHVMKSKLNFDYHMKHKHNDSPIDTRVQCEICSAWLKDKKILRKHKQNLHETTNQQHFCNECGKQCPSASALRNHKRHVHKLTRSHKCDVCDKAFKVANLLKEHMTIHTGERLYTCPFCPATMNSSANLYAHKKKAHPIEWTERKNKL